MVASTLHSWHVPAVPHARPTQLTQVMQAAGDPWQKAELVQETPGLQREERLRGQQAIGMQGNSGSTWNQGTHSWRGQHSGLGLHWLPKGTMRYLGSLRHLR